MFVDDHIEALLLIAKKGIPGSRYCIGGGDEIRNLDLVKLICKKIDEKYETYFKSDRLISFVEDRPGHDYRYSIDSTKIREELNWKPKVTFEEGLRKTILWYLNNMN